VLAELSKVADLRLDGTAPGIADEVLLISAEEVPVADLLANIAEVTSAEWTRHGSSLRLVPSYAAKVRKRQRLLKQRVYSLSGKEGLFSEDRVINLGRPPVAADGKAHPESQLLADILRRIGTTALATIEPGHRVVYSTDPTRAQRSLPRGTRSTIQSIAELAESESEERPRTRIGFVKANLAFARALGDDTIDVSLILFGSDGRTTYKVDRNLFPTGSPNWRETDRRDPEQTEDKVRTPISYSTHPIVRGALESAPQESARCLAAEPYRSILLRPDLYEPLGLQPSDALLSLSRHLRKPIVANVPDYLFDFFKGEFGLTVEKFHWMLGNGGWARLDERKGWLIVRPSDDLRSGTDRTNRPALVGQNRPRGLPFA
jgi:hypothetical protein